MVGTFTTLRISQQIRLRSLLQLWPYRRNHRYHFHSHIYRSYPRVTTANPEEVPTQSNPGAGTPPDETGDSVTGTPANEPVPADEPVPDAPDTPDAPADEPDE